MMSSPLSCFLLSALAVAPLLARAVPAPAPAALSARQSGITTLTTAQINSFTPYAFFASAGYCQPAATLAWNCGANCNAESNFIPTASGGDGDSVQFWYVGFSPSLNSVVVSNQGTDTSEILPLITDGDIVLEQPDSTLFPGLSSSIEAHSGFLNAHSKSATAILSAVQTAMSAHGTNSVTLTGHSLGAAISLLHAVYLPLHLPTAKITYVGFGLPRVGNQAFANYVDAHASVASVTHVNNKEDLVPILPGRFLGFHHPSGEVHIMDSGAWVACPGQDNTSDECIVGDVPNIFEGDESDHDGPYGPVEMGC